MKTPTVTCRMALSIAAAGGLVACSTTQVNTDFDSQAKFSQYRTFDVQPGKIVQGGDLVADDTLVKGRIEDALGSTLSEKGLTETRANPDLLVTYTAGAKTVDEIENAWDGGWYWGGGFDGVWEDEYTEGTLVIDVVDASTKKLVFRSVATAEDDDFRSQDFIQKTVEKALKKYPPEPGEKPG